MRLTLGGVTTLASILVATAQVQPPARPSPANEPGDPAGTRSGVWYVSDPGGLFTLVGIPPGPLVLLARAESDQGPLLGLASTEVTVDAVEDIRITIDRPGSVEGRVVYDEAPPDTKASVVALIQKVFRVSAIYPVPEATIDASNRFGIPDALGEYEPELRGLPAGYRVTRVMRNGVTLDPPRIIDAGGEVVTGIEIRVARQGR